MKGASVAASHTFVYLDFTLKHLDPADIYIYINVNVSLDKSHRGRKCR